MKEEIDLSYLNNEQRQIIKKVVELLRENQMLKEIIKDLTKFL